MKPLGLALLGLLLAPTETRGDAAVSEVLVRVRLRSDQSVAAELVGDAGARAGTLLAAAGIGLTWLDCNPTSRDPCDAPPAASEIDILLAAAWPPRSDEACGGGVRVRSGPRTFAISVDWVRSAAAASHREADEVLALVMVHQIVHAWSALPHDAETAGPLGSPPAPGPRDVVLIAGALLQDRRTEAAVERKIVVGPDGRWVSITDFDPATASADTADEAAMAMPDAHLRLVHNHPRSNGLSGQDVMTLIKPGVNTVEAIGHDGSVYVARRGRTFSAAAYHMAAAQLAAAARGLPPRPDVQAALATHHAHLVALVLHRSDAIEYEPVLVGERANTFRRYGIWLEQVVNVASAARRKALLASSDLRERRQK